MSAHWDYGDGYTADQIDESTMAIKRDGVVFAFLHKETREERIKRERMESWERRNK